MSARVGLALLAALLGGCLDDALGIPLDGGLADLRGRDIGLLDPFDLGLPRRDMAMPACTHVDTWTDPAPQIRASPTESPFDWVTWARSFDGKTALSVEVWHDQDTDETPYTMQLPGDTNYLLCEVCVLVDLSFDAAVGWGSPAYLALGGEVTVTRADTSPSGRLQVSGRDVRLVEWDFAGDRPRPGGGCWEIGAFSLEGSYSGDGGDPPRWKF